MANFDAIRDILNNPTDHNLPEWTNGQYDITGENLKGYLSMLLSGMESADDFFNVNAYNSESQYGSSALARAAVPTNVKKLGLVIAYKLSDGWFIDQFIGSNISGWGTASNWKALGPVSVSQNTLTIGGDYKGEVSTTYDVTLHNDGITFESLESLFSDGNLATLIPAEVRKGGMCLRFIKTSNNKYLQYRLTSATFNTILSNWQSQDLDLKQDKLESVTEQQYQGQEDEIVITDDNDNEIGKINSNGADFKNLKSNGEEVLTKEIPLKEETTIDIDDTIEINDGSGNKVGVIDNNGADFKNLKSNGKDIIPLPKYDYYRKVLLFSATELSELTNTTWTQTSGGNMVCVGTGTSNKLTLSKDFFSDYREFQILMTLGSDDKFIFLFTAQSASYGHIVGKSKMYIDYANKKMGVHKIDNPSSAVITNVVTEKDITQDITHPKVLITIKRVCCSIIFTITDYYTGKSVIQVFDNLGWEYGAMNGYLDLYLESGAIMPSIDKIEVYSGLEPDIVFAGDSITECIAIKTDVMKGMPYLFKADNLKTKAMIWARGGCTINSLLLQWDLEMAKIKPKIIVLNIGANGGNSTHNFNSFKTKCDAIGAKLVICYTVCFTMENRDYRIVNQEIKTYCDNNSIPFIRLDIATALNNVDAIDNTQQPDLTLFLADEVHPNIDGNAAMYQRLKVDANYLFNI